MKSRLLGVYHERLSHLHACSPHICHMQPVYYPQYSYARMHATSSAACFREKD